MNINNESHISNMWVKYLSSVLNRIGLLSVFMLATLTGEAVSFVGAGQFSSGKQLF